MGVNLKIIKHAGLNNAGFSLVELMIVVGIMAILAAIAIPSYFGYIGASKRKTAESVLEQFPLILETFRAENGRLPLDGTYDYTENDDGTLLLDEISLTPEAGGTAAALTDFKPRPATYPKNEGILYHYQLIITNSGTTNEQATFEALPQTQRGAPEGNIPTTGPAVYK